MAGNPFDLYRETEKMALQEGSLYRDVRACRDDLLDFMAANRWFGLEVRRHGDAICFDDGEVLRGPLSLWLRAYRRTGAERMDILCGEFRDVYPGTCLHFTEYLRER